MAQFDETQFNICGEKNNMINYKGKVFTRLMPIYRIKSISENNCLNCEIHGSWNGCIIMYCINCDPFGCGAISNGVECNPLHPNSATKTYLRNVDLNTIGDIALEDSKKIYGNISLIQSEDIDWIKLSKEFSDEEGEEEEGEEEEEHIQVFLTENKKEEKWFEMKIAEYDEAEEGEEIEEGEEVKEGEPLNLIVNEQESLVHKIIDRFFTQTNQFIPPFQDTKSTFYERFLHNCYQSDIQYATEFATELDDEISSASNSSSTTTYTELPELQENDGNMYFNIVEDNDSDSDEELQKLKHTRIEPLAVERMNLADLVKDAEKEETQEQYELRTQTGIFDWPKSRLGEDECSYYGVCFEKKISDPY